MGKKLSVATLYFNLHDRWFSKEINTFINLSYYFIGKSLLESYDVKMLASRELKIYW